MSEVNYEIYRNHAWLYDAAFDWDIEDEVDWLLERLGKGVSTILEPACGSGRMFPPFARRGITVFGVDRSEEMLARAESRMAALGLPPPRTFRDDIRDFDLGGTFDGAICPINSFCYLLTEEDALRHLACMARHLRPGGKYLPQVDLRWLAGLSGRHEPETGKWEVDHERGRIRVNWFGKDYDQKTRIEIQVCRFEFIDGPDEGKVIEEEHPQRLWDFESWRELIEASPFTQVAAYDGSVEGRPAVMCNDSIEDRLLTWHELVKE